MTSITIGDLTFPAGILAQHMAVLGKTRSGKSSVLRLFVENLLHRGQRVCVLDPKGDWWGLKSSADGKKAGYPVVIFGGERADVPLNSHAGGSVAELVTSGNRPCVIDLGGWMVADRTRFFLDFASHVFRSINAPLWLVIDEVHNFAPQTKFEKNPDAMKMLHWANRLASEGAGKGLVILSASQRPQKVHKDFLTCAETLIAMRVIHALDRAAIREWVDGAGDPEKGREVLKTLASMKRGEGWVWSPEIEFGPERVQFPLFSTYDSFAAPTGHAGKSAGNLKGWAEVDLGEVTAKLAAVVEEAKANDPAELKRQLAELRKQLAAKQGGDPDQAKKFEAERHAWRGLEKDLRAQLAQADKTLRQIASLAGGTKIELPEKCPTSRDLPGFTPRNNSDASAQVERFKHAKRVTVNPAVDYSKKHSGGDDSFTPSERAILKAFYWLKDQTATPPLVSFYSGYASSSSTWDKALGKLRRQWVSGWQITSDGIATVESWGVEPKPRGPDLREWLRRRLGPAENKLLDSLIAAYPQRLTSDELSAASGYAKSSSTWDKAIGRLRALEAAEGYDKDGGIKAADVFFE